MLDIINEVKELYQRLLVRDKKLAEDKAKLLKRSEIIESKIQALDNKKVELDKREKIIKEIEDVVALRDQVATAYQKLTSDKKILSREKAQFEEDKKSSLEEIKNDKEAVSSRRIKLQKAERDLDGMKSEYKKEVMASINKSLKERGITL